MDPVVADPDSNPDPQHCLKVQSSENLRKPTVAPIVKSHSDIQVICKHIYMFTLKRNLTTAFSCTKSFAYSGDYKKNI